MPIGQTSEPWEALYSAIADELFTLAGQVMTRSVGPTAAGAGTIVVESTLRFPDEGTLAIDGHLVAYTGRTITSFTGVTYDGAAAPPVLVRAHSVVLDASATTTQLDRLRQSFDLAWAEDSELDIIGRNGGLVRPLGMGDIQYRALLQAALYIRSQTMHCCEVLLDIVVGPGLYTLYEDFVDNPFTVFVAFPAIGPFSTQYQGKAYLIGGEEQPRTGANTVDVDQPPTLAYGVYDVADPFRVGTNYANAPFSGLAVGDEIATLAQWIPEDENTGLEVLVGGEQQWWRVRNVVTTSLVTLWWPPRPGAQVEPAALDHIRVDTYWFAPWVVGHGITIADGVNVGTYEILEYIDAYTVRIGASLVPDAEMTWGLTPNMAGACTGTIHRATVAGSTVTAPVTLPADVLVDYTTVPSAQLVESPMGDGNEQYPFYFWDRGALARYILDLFTAAGVQVVTEFV